MEILPWRGNDPSPRLVLAWPRGTSPVRSLSGGLGGYQVPKFFRDTWFAASIPGASPSPVGLYLLLAPEPPGSRGR